MNHHRALLLCVIFLMCIGCINAQEMLSAVKSDLMPASPQSSQYIAVQAPRPSLLTGAVDFSIPLYTISVGDMNIPISLQYHSNGIKVFDDPCPVGYGWCLQPALRATRTIMGRPDEHFEYKNPGMLTSSDAYIMGYQCMVNQFDESQISDRTAKYDSQHDIITIALPGITITRVIVIDGDSICFVGCSDDEYLVRSDRKLNKITVVDPLGNTYTYGAPYEYQPSDSAPVGELRTAWALVSIELNDTRVIDFGWSLRGHPGITRRYMGGASFMDSWDQLQVGNTGIDPETFINSAYLNAILTPASTVTEFLNLDYITFPGGKIQFNYTQISNCGSRLDQVTVQNDDGVTIRSARLDYKSIAVNQLLLNSVILGNDECYSFDYITPTDYSGTRINSQDWWGYYNGRDNESLTPRLSVRSLTCIQNTDSCYFRELGEADRNIDVVAMQCNLLQRITYPGGGTSEFYYEPHSFTPIDHFAPGEIHPKYDPQLNCGGGLRVQRIITRSQADDTNPIEAIYRYGECVVRSVPSAATFITTSLTAQGIDENFYAFGTDAILRMRMVSIQPFSDYTRYDIGEIPMWYRSVTEEQSEGRTIYYFEDSDIPHNNLGRSYGHFAIGGLYRIFSKGPQLVRKDTYKSDGGTYTLVERQTNEYEIVTGSEWPESTYIEREMIFISRLEGKHSAPDFDDGQYMRNELPYSSTGDIKELPEAAGSNTFPYTMSVYSIVPRTERLVKTVTTNYCGLDSISRENRISYFGKTSLVQQQRSKMSDGSEHVTTATYPTPNAGGIIGDMAKAHVIGQPIFTVTSQGKFERFSRVEPINLGGRIFRTGCIRSWNAGAADTIVTPKYSYNKMGNLTGITDADGVSQAYLWGYDGLYPIARIDGIDNSAIGSTINWTNKEIEYLTLPEGALMTRCEYTPLVGVTMLKDAKGTINRYGYDAEGRLVSTSIDGHGPVSAVSYKRGAQDGYDHIRESIIMDSTGNRRTQDTSYDGLGRITTKYDSITNIATHYRYDNMGRMTGVSIPKVGEPGAYDWTTTGYEPSGRGLKTTETKAGRIWQTENKSVTIDRTINTSQGLYSCPRYSIDNNGNITHHGMYAAGTIYINRTEDEDGHVTLDFTDMAGRTVMSRQIGDNTTHDTRWIYDDAGNLRAILPPALEDCSRSADDMDMQTYGYIYRYDDLNRLIECRNPGSLPAYTIYSRAGRVFAEHTPSMSEDTWVLHIYDHIGRECLLLEAVLDAEQVRNIARIFPLAERCATGIYGGYNIGDNTILSGISVLKSVHYDTYTDNDEVDPLPGYRPTLSGGQTMLGTPTGLVTTVIDYGTSTSSKACALATRIYYDQLGREIQRVRAFPDGILTRSTIYNYDGTPGVEHLLYERDGYDDIERVTNIAYDNSGRQIRQTIIQNGNTASISTNYDSSGRVSSQQMRSGVIRRYSYDLHGWLTRSTIQVPIYVTKNTISSSKAASYYKALPQSTEQGQLFPITPTIQDAVITFTDSLLYTNGAYPRYNGVVSSRIHTNGGRYNYRYDDFDRLESAEYIASSNADSAEDFSTDYSYDAMGNITRILRQGIIDYDGATEEFGVLDALELTYDGNHVESVYQQGEGKMYYGRTGYGVGNEATEEEYKWSKAGNLYSDTSRSIAGISYNRNAQPLSITKSNGSSVAYSYSSDGECLSATSTVVLTIGKVKRKLTGVRRRYVEDFVFENDTLKYSYFAGGYFDENGAVRYIHKDHQGSTIMVTDSVDGICQQIGYYPYGEPWREPTGQPRLFSGKEREKMMSLRDYDFTARRYNSAICQWTTPDQYASKFAYTSPTVYCASNPIKFVDPDGKEITLSKGLKLFSKIVVMVNLQMLTNDILSLKKDNNGLEKVCIVKTFDGGKEYGTKLIRDLISSPRRVEIDYRNSKKINVKGCDKDTNYAYPTKKYRSGGSDVRINFSNKIDITVLTFDTKNQTTQWERRPAFIGMAHELIHAIHMMDGKYYMSKKDSGYSADEFNVEEENSTIGLYFSNGYPTENDIRAEHQLHNRIAYLYE